MKKILSIISLAALTIGLLGSCKKEDPKVSVTGVTLDQTTLTITVGDADVQLTATVAPDNATDKTVSWSSDKTEFATVDNQGNVHAVAPGTANITVTTTDEGKTATCVVTVITPDYVKIGGLKWKKMNIGATTVAGSIETCAGYYFAWGGTEAYVYSNSDSQWKSVKDGSVLSGGFSKANAPHYSTLDSKYTKYTTGETGDGKTVLEATDDAATAFLGSGWRMPTSQECKALADACGGIDSYDNTTYASTSCGESTTFAKGIYWCGNYDGVAGGLFCDGTNKLFFPVTGMGWNSNLQSTSTTAICWSSSLNTSKTDSGSAYRLIVVIENLYIENSYSREVGSPIRAVADIK
ncbi:MAG: Ig-like domain-containing protein [Bacteroidales bacterium]|nr:Ig-like domain-containing protein [Bacteroidales bacterium]